MLIKKVFIDGLGCLKNFHIDFNEPHSEHGQHGTTTYTLVGKNGTGKSTFLEAILRIFAVFDSESVIRDAYFDFDIEYEYASKNIKITREANKYTIWQDGNLLTQNTTLSTAKKKLYHNPGHIFPRRIISFYSGTQDIFSPVEKKTFKNYKRNTLNAFYDELYSKDEKKFLSTKKYSSVCDEYTDLYLASILLSIKNKEKLNKLNISIKNEVVIEIFISLKILSQLMESTVFKIRGENIDYYKKEVENLLFTTFSLINKKISLSLKYT